MRSRTSHSWKHRIFSVFLAISALSSLMIPQSFAFAQDEQGTGPLKIRQALADTSTISLDIYRDPLSSEGKYHIYCDAGRPIQTSITIDPDEIEYYSIFPDFVRLLVPNAQPDMRYLCRVGELIDGGDVIRMSESVSVTTAEKDCTPRISYWWGKVNQHINPNTCEWETHPGGNQDSQGASADKLEYCRYWYPNTERVEQYRSSEVITGWKDRGNRANYVSLKPSYECVQEDTSQNLAPVIDSISAPTAIATGEQFEVMVGASDPENGRLSYFFDFGDSRNVRQTFVQNASATHTYNRAGTYTVRVTVRDEDGNTAESSVSVFVENPIAKDTNAPVVKRVWTSKEVYSGGETPIFYAHVVDDLSEVEEIQIEYSPDSSNSPRGYIFESGDSLDAFYQGNGIYAFTDVSLSPIVPNFPKTQYTLSRVSVKDSAGNQKEYRPDDSFRIVPKDQSLEIPVIQVINGPTALEVGEKGEWNVVTSDRDSSELTYVFDFGDKSSQTIRSKFLQETTFSHTYDQSGEYLLQVTARDEDGNEAKTSVTVIVRDNVNREKFPDSDFIGINFKSDAMNIVLPTIKNESISVEKLQSLPEFKGIVHGSGVFDATTQRYFFISSEKSTGDQYLIGFSLHDKKITKNKLSSNVSLLRYNSVDGYLYAVSSGTLIRIDPNNGIQKVIRKFSEDRGVPLAGAVNPQKQEFVFALNSRLFTISLPSGNVLSSPRIDDKNLNAFEFINGKLYAADFENKIIGTLDQKTGNVSRVGGIEGFNTFQSDFSSTDGKRYLLLIGQKGDNRKYLIVLDTHTGQVFEKKWYRKQILGLEYRNKRIIPQQPTGCAEIYAPVCGQVQVQCIVAPCLPVSQTFSNRCEAEQAGATNIEVGVCAFSTPDNGGIDDVPSLPDFPDVPDFEPPAGFEDDVVTNSAQNPFRDTSLATLTGQAAKYLYESAVIGGYDDGTFKSVKSVNRVEMAKFLLNASDTPIRDVQSYGNDVPWDIKIDQWYAKYALAAKETGIMNGYADGSFRPADTVTTAEAIVMLARAFDVPERQNLSPYRDANSVDWLRGYTWIVDAYDLQIELSDQILGINTPLTRGQVAIMMYQFLKNRSSDTSATVAGPNNTPSSASDDANELPSVPNIPTLPDLPSL